MTSWVRIAFAVAPGYERTKVSLLGTDTRDGRFWVRNPRKRSVLGTGAPGYERAKVRSWVRIGPKVVAPSYGFAREKVGATHRGATRTPLTVLIIWVTKIDITTPRHSANYTASNAAQTLTPFGFEIFDPSPRIFQDDWLSAPRPISARQSSSRITSRLTTTGTTIALGQRYGSTICANSPDTQQH